MTLHSYGSEFVHLCKLAKEGKRESFLQMSGIMVVKIYFYYENLFCTFIHLFGYITVWRLLTICFSFLLHSIEMHVFTT